MQFCVELGDGTGSGDAGGKAAQLASVRAAGARVPATFVILRSALRAVLAQAGLEAAVAAYRGTFGEGNASVIEARYAELRAAVRSAALPDALHREIIEVSEVLLADAPAGLAVRSSAVYEDSERASCAGVFESYVGLTRPDAVVAAVVDCWCSAWTPRAFRYLLRMGIEPVADAMAVIVQRVVPASAAGVIHTANADTGDPWQFVLHARRGLSVDLMSGSGAGDRYCIDWRSAEVIEQRIEGSGSTLSQADIAAIAEAARTLDEDMGTRLDIEWALCDGLWILQARPLTALPQFFPAQLTASDADRTWQRAEWVVGLRKDSPPALVTPFFADLSESELWHRHQPEDFAFTSLWKDARDWLGYRYIDDGPRGTFLAHFKDLAQCEAWLEGHEAEYRERWERREAAVDQIAAAAREAMATLHDVRQLIRITLEVRDRYWDLISFSWSGPQALGWMCEGLMLVTLRRLDSGLRLETTGGDSESHTFQVTLALQEMGRSLHEPAVIEAFEHLQLGEIIPHLLATVPDSAFMAAYESFCWRFGRTPPSWHGRPPFWTRYFDEGDAPAMHAMRSAYRGQSRDVRIIQHDARLARLRDEAAVRAAAVARAPELADRFDRMLGWMRYWTQALNDRHGLSVALLWKRELIWSLGTRMMTEGLIDRVEDVLVLRRGDLESYADGSSDDAELRAIYLSRRQEYERHRRLIAPDTLGAPAHAANARPAEASPATPTSADERVEFRGVGFATGVASGRARIVRELNSELLDALTSDDVLVLPFENAFAYADWHSLLTLVRGVVSPGRPAHHLSQVARECRVPVVGRVQGDLTTIREGAVLHIDGHAGVIRVENAVARS